MLDDLAATTPCGLTRLFIKLFSKRGDIWLSIYPVRVWRSQPSHFSSVVYQL